jgi:uncharacterized membrane protein
VRRRDDRGAVLVLTALVLPVLLVATSFAVDLGRQRVARRDMQGKADVIALDLARLIDGTTTAQNLVYGDSLARSAARNNVALSKVQAVEWGTLAAGSHKFIACTTCVPTAVRVTMHDAVDRLFQPGNGSVTRSAVASQGSPKAGMTIGSFAAQLPTSSTSILALATSLLGSDASAQLVGFNGLASSQLNVADLLAASPINVLSPAEVADTDVSLRDFLLASATALSQNGTPGDAANAVLLQNLAGVAVPGVPIHLADLVRVDPESDGAELDTKVNALDLVLAAAQLANGKSGAEVKNLGINLSNLGGTGISLAEVATDLDVIQPPQFIFGGPGTTGRTDQVAAQIRAKLLGGALGGLANATVTIDLGTASGVGTIGAIHCGTPQSFDFAASSSLLQTKVTVTVTLLGIPINITVAKPPASDYDTGTFVRTDDLSNPDAQTFTPDPYTVNNGKLGLSGIAPTVSLANGGALSALLNSLLSPLLGIVTGTLLPVLDTYLLGPLVTQLGVNVGGAELHGIRTACAGGVRLVG